MALGALIKQEIKHLELENYSFNDIVNYLNCIMKPDSIATYRNMIDLAELLWDRVGRGDTLLDEIPFEQWLRNDT